MDANVTEVGAEVPLHLRSYIGIQRGVRDLLDGPVSRGSLKLEHGLADACSALRSRGLRAAVGLILLASELFHFRRIASATM